MGFVKSSQASSSLSSPSSSSTPTTRLRNTSAIKENGNLSQKSTPSGQHNDDVKQKLPIQRAISVNPECSSPVQKRPSVTFTNNEKCVASPSSVSAPNGAIVNNGWKKASSDRCTHKQSKPNQTRPRSTTQIHSGIIRRHGQRTAKSTVSDGEIDLNRTTIPPALPRLSVNQEKTSESPKSLQCIQSGIPMPRQVNHANVFPVDPSRLSNNTDRRIMIPRNARGESQPLESKHTLHAPQLPLGSPSTCPNSPRYFSRSGRNDLSQPGHDISLGQYNLSNGPAQSGRDVSPMQQRQPMFGYMIVPGGQTDGSNPQIPYGQNDRIPVSWPQYPMYNCPGNAFQTQTHQYPVGPVYTFCPSTREPSTSCSTLVQSPPPAFQHNVHAGIVPQGDPKCYFLNPQRTLPNSTLCTTTAQQMFHQSGGNSSGSFTMQHPFVPPAAYHPPAPPARGQSLCGQHQPPNSSATSQASEFLGSQAGRHRTKLSRPSTINTMGQMNFQSDKPVYFADKASNHNEFNDRKTVGFQTNNFNAKPSSIDSSPCETRSSTKPIGFTGNSKLLAQAEQRQRAKELYAALKHRHPSSGAVSTLAHAESITTTQSYQAPNSSGAETCSIQKQKPNHRKPSQRCVSSPTTPVHEHLPHFRQFTRQNNQTLEQKTDLRFPYSTESEQSTPTEYRIRSSVEKATQLSGSSSGSSAGGMKNISENATTQRKLGRPVSSTSPYFTRATRIDQSGVRTSIQSQSRSKQAQHGSSTTLSSTNGSNKENAQTEPKQENAIPVPATAQYDLKMLPPSAMPLLRTSLPKYYPLPVSTTETATTKATNPNYLPESFSKLVQDRTQQQMNTVQSSLIHSYDAQLLTWAALQNQKPVSADKGVSEIPSDTNATEEIDTHTWPSKTGSAAWRKNRSTISGSENPSTNTNHRRLQYEQESKRCQAVMQEEMGGTSFTNSVGTTPFSGEKRSPGGVINRPKARPLSGGMFRHDAFTNLTIHASNMRDEQLSSFRMSAEKQEEPQMNRTFMSNSETGPSCNDQQHLIDHNSEALSFPNRSGVSRESSVSHGLPSDAQQCFQEKRLSGVERYNTLPGSQRGASKFKPDSSNPAVLNTTDLNKLSLVNGRNPELHLNASPYSQRRLLNLPVSNGGGVCGVTKRSQEMSDGGTISAPPGTPIKLPYAAPSYRLHQNIEANAIHGLNIDGSNLSLSSNMSNNSEAEQNYDDEVRMLRQKLNAAQTQVALLTSQLITNAQVVSAFEQSLNSISQRLKNLTTTTARKDSELHELRATIDALRCQSGFNLGNLSIHSLIAPGTLALSNGTQFQPTVPQTLEQHAHQATPAHVPSADEPINKQQTSDGKSGEGSHRKGSWFRGSIGKAFRKKSSLPPTKPATISVHDAVQTTSSTQSSTGVTYSEASVTQVNLNPLSNVLNPKCPSEPITASIGSQVHMPQGNRLPLNGLSPSNSSTSNSSWSTSGINPQQDLWRNSGGKSSFAATMPNDRTFNLSNGTNGPSQTPNCSRHTIVPPYLHESNQTVESESPYSFTESQSEKASLETCAKDGSNILHTDHSRWFGPAMDETISDLSSTDPAIAAKLQAELKRLRHQLSERDMKLTDVQLEALASTHQVNQLRDQLTRLYAEMQHLRSDNARLQQMMTTPTSSTSTEAEAKPVEEPGCCTNNAGSGVNDTTWISNSEFDLFAGFIQEFHTRRRGTLSLDNSLCAKLKISTDDTKQLNLGLIYLSTFDSWAALDSHLERLYRQYVSRIDPQDRLSILDEGIVMYKVQSDSISHEHRITESEEVQGELDNFPSIMQSLPFGAIEVLLEMRTHPSGYTASMSVTSLLPRPIVEAYLEFLEEHHCLVLCVDKETGKELTAVLLSCLKRIGRITEEHYINMDGGNQAVDKLKTCLNTFREVGVTNRQWNDVGKAIVIDRMDDVMTVVEFQECLQQAGWNSVNSTENGEKNRTYIIALSNPKPPPINSTPVVQNSLPNAKVYLSPGGHCWICAEQQNYEQLNYVVRQSLKQRLIHLLVDQTINKEPGQEREHIAFMQRLTGWLEEVWNRVNHAVTKSYPNNVVSGFLSPKIFEDLPLTNTEDWFVESWNSRIIEKVCELHGSRKNIQPDEDPKNWVLSNWPWSTLSSSEENKSRFLLPLFPQQD